MNDDTRNTTVDTSRVLDELVRSNSTRTSSKTRRQRLRIVLILMFLSPLVLGIVYATYGQWRVQDTLAALERENQALRSAQQSAEAQVLSQIGRINNQLGDMIADTGVDEQLVARLQDDFNRQVQGINDTVTVVQRQILAQQNRDAQWLYGESEFLLRLANQKLQLEGDINSALILISTVDNLLADLELRQRDNPAIAVLRQNLAEDMRILRAVTQLDMPATYQRIASLAAAAEELTLMTSLRDAYQEQLESRWQNNADVRAESGFWQSGMGMLRAIFVWREWEEAPGDMLPPQQEYYIKQNLQLMLEQAQLALLMREETLFYDALQRSQDWLSKYQLQETQQGRLLLREFEELMLLRLKPTLPDLTVSLRMVRQLSNAGDL